MNAEIPKHFLIYKKTALKDFKNTLTTYPLAYLIFNFLNLLANWKCNSYKTEYCNTCEYSLVQKAIWVPFNWHTSPLEGLLAIYRLRTPNEFSLNIFLLSLLDPTLWNYHGMFDKGHECSVQNELWIMTPPENTGIKKRQDFPAKARQLSIFHCFKPAK